MKERVFRRRQEMLGGKRTRIWAALLLVTVLLFGTLTGCGTRVRDAGSNPEKESSATDAETGNTGSIEPDGNGKPAAEVSALGGDLAAASEKVEALLNALRVQEEDQTKIQETLMALGGELNPQPSEEGGTAKPNAEAVKATMEELQAAWKREALNKVAAALENLNRTLSMSAEEINWETAKERCKELEEAWNSYTSLSAPEGISAEQAQAAESDLINFQNQIHELQDKQTELQSNVYDLQRLDELETHIKDLEKGRTSLLVFSISLLTLIGVAILVARSNGAGGKRKGKEADKITKDQTSDPYAEKMEGWIKELRKVRDAADDQRLEVSNFLGRIEKMERQMKELSSKTPTAPSAATAASTANLGGGYFNRGNQGSAPTSSAATRTNVQQPSAQQVGKIYHFNFDRSKTSRNGDVYLRETFGTGVFSGVEKQGYISIWPDVWGLEQVPKFNEDLGRTSKMQLYNGQEAIKMCFDVDPDYPPRDEVFRITLTKYAFLQKSELGNYKLLYRGAVKATGMGD